MTLLRYSVRRDSGRIARPNDGNVAIVATTVATMANTTTKPRDRHWIVGISSIPSYAVTPLNTIHVPRIAALSPRTTPESIGSVVSIASARRRTPLDAPTAASVARERRRSPTASTAVISIVAAAIANV